MMASPDESVAMAFASVLALPPRNVEASNEALPPAVGLNSDTNASCVPVKLWLGQITGKLLEVVVPVMST